MRINSFLRALDPEVWVRLEHVDGHEVASNQAESVIKHGNPHMDVLGAYPECSPLTNGRLSITVLVEEVKD